ncbi:hypothetical protein QTG54_000011 [Skeletonema marinoi]|uniref:Cytochrome b561 domain-containing protein n=1 Tax=Skeletonema marinoi TaxID=267567 RepID=A0AAD8YMP8_9STRA|nr:hypothetical protein QTG54_000011 [Skeletonema marinoi]
MAKMTPLPTNKYLLLLSIVIGHSLLGGYYAGTRPEGAGWRFFSWHPFLMMVGMVGLMGTATLTKKRMGYTNTKLHGMIAWAGLMSSYAGFYVIYQNKNTMGKITIPLSTPRLDWPCWWVRPCWEWRGECFYIRILD